jgi:hypothetical protein
MWKENVITTDITKIPANVYIHWSAHIMIKYFQLEWEEKFLKETLLTEVLHRAKYEILNVTWVVRTLYMERVTASDLDQLTRTFARPSSSRKVGSVTCGWVWVRWIQEVKRESQPHDDVSERFSSCNLRKESGDFRNMNWSTQKRSGKKICRQFWKAQILWMVAVSLRLLLHQSLRNFESLPLSCRIMENKRERGGRGKFEISGESDRVLRHGERGKTFSPSEVRKMIYFISSDATAPSASLFLPIPWHLIQRIVICPLLSFFCEIIFILVKFRNIQTIQNIHRFTATQSYKIMK